MLLGNGSGTFTPAGLSQPSGGHTWVVVVDDVNGDGNLDVGAANSISGNGAILLGDGLGEVRYARHRHGRPIPLSGPWRSTPATEIPTSCCPSSRAALALLHQRWHGHLHAPARDHRARQPVVLGPLRLRQRQGTSTWALTDELADVMVPDGEPRDPRRAALEPPAPSRSSRTARTPSATARPCVCRFRPRADVRLDVFDLGGRRVAGTDPMLREAGRQEIPVRRPGSLRAHSSARASTPYRVSAGAAPGTAKMVVAR